MVVVIMPKLAPVALIGVVLAMILCSLVEYARDEAILARIDKMIRTATANRADMARLQDQALEVRVRSKKDENWQRRAEARDEEANAETVVDEEI